MPIKHSTDFGKYAAYLTDEAHLLQGDAQKIFFPASAEEIAAIVRQAQHKHIPITVSGGGTGISGGRVPQKGWIIATDKLLTIPNGVPWTDPETKITYTLLFEQHGDSALLTVPAAITVKAIQNYVHETGWFYPPDPTERSSFIGGNVSTNASGARSFKYGATRQWVHQLQIVLPNGDIFTADRTESSVGVTVHITSANAHYTVPVPDYPIAQTRKNVAGPILNTESKAIDLFIGTEGIFGIVTQITLKLIRAPKQIISIMAYCDSVEKALTLVEHCIENRERQQEPIPLSVEYLDERASKIMHNTDENIPEHVQATIILEQELTEATADDYIMYWIDILDTLEIEDSSVAQSYVEIEHHKQLRHTVPETMNILAKSNGYSKLGTDYAVPIQYLRNVFSFAFALGREFEEYQNSQHPLEKFGYALWSHAGDAHIHVNFLPRSTEEHKKAKNLMVKFMQQVVAWGGTIAAEHGLGKKQFNNHPALYFQYGQTGISQIAQMKLTLDPQNLLNQGNLIGKLLE